MGKVGRSSPCVLSRKDPRRPWHDVGLQDLYRACTYRLLSSSFWELPYRILNINHIFKKELLRSLGVGLSAYREPQTPNRES